MAQDTPWFNPRGGGYFQMDDRGRFMQNQYNPDNVHIGEGYGSGPTSTGNIHDAPQVAAAGGILNPFGDLGSLTSTQLYEWLQQNGGYIDSSGKPVGVMQNQDGTFDVRGAAGLIPGPLASSTYSQFNGGRYA